MNIGWTSVLKQCQLLRTEMNCLLMSSLMCWTGKVVPVVPDCSWMQFAHFEVRCVLSLLRLTQLHPVALQNDDEGTTVARSVRWSVEIELQVASMEENTRPDV